MGTGTGSSIFDQIEQSKLYPSTKFAVQLLILTACRTSEVRESTWDEIDFENKLWRIPAKRMKMNSPHNIPLSDGAMAVLKKAQDLRNDNPLIFPSPLSNRALSSNALLHALQKRLKIDATIHGMRSAFKDWVAETTNYPNEVSEMALAHSISNQTEAAYRRGELLGKRRSMMQDWSDFVQGTEEKVLTLVISKSAWWKGVKAGSYPAPIKLSENVTVWRSDEIQSLVNEICNHR